MPKASSPQERLSNLEFLALVKAGLEELAPGVTEGAVLRGSSLMSPQGWVLGMAPPHGSGHHYDVVAFPEVDVTPGAGFQDGLPCFVDCAVTASGDPWHAVDAWVRTSGACFLEMLDRSGRFADHAGPDDARGVAGWHMIASGEVGYGLDNAEIRRLQEALHEANVVHRLADVLSADLESPYFNGIKLFYGGTPGAMQCEIRVNGERHEAASAAMAALGLPEPTTFTAVRAYALLLPMSSDGVKPAYQPATKLNLQHENAADSELPEDHCHGTGCSCGGHLDPEHPGFAFAMPYLVEDLSPEEREQRVRVDTGAMIVADGVGNFLKVRLPIHLEDGRTLVYLAWVYLEVPVIEEVVRRVHAGTLPGHRFQGQFCNAVEPWGEDLLRAAVTLEGRQPTTPGGVGIPEVVDTSHRTLKKVLRKRWPAEVVLGARDPRLRVG